MNVFRRVKQIILTSCLPCPPAGAEPRLRLRDHGAAAAAGGVPAASAGAQGPRRYTEQKQKQN